MGDININTAIATIEEGLRDAWLFPSILAPRHMEGLAALAPRLPTAILAALRAALGRALADMRETRNGESAALLAALRTAAVGAHLAMGAELRRRRQNAGRMAGLVGDGGRWPETRRGHA